MIIIIFTVKLIIIIILKIILGKDKGRQIIKFGQLTSSSAAGSSSSPLKAKKEGSPVNVDVNFSACSLYSKLIDGNAFST